MKKKRENINQLEKEILKNQILLRDKELSEFLVSQSIKMEKFKDITESIFNYMESNEVMMIEKNRNLFNDFMKTQTKESPLPDRIEFQYHFIVSALKKLHPELSGNDVKHCLLIKLNLTIKESAQLLNVTIGTVKTARSRARAKINIPDDISLKVYLDNLEIHEGEMISVLNTSKAK